MKRISSILAIFLVVSAVAIVAVSAGTRDDGNSTAQNDTAQNDTVIVEPIPNTSDDGIQDGNNDIVQADVNETDTTITNLINETDTTVTPVPPHGNIVHAPVNTHVNAIPKTNEGVKITALHPLCDGVEYVNITNENSFTAHLEGFELKEMSCGNSFVFPDIDIKPGKTLTVYTKKGVNTGSSFYMGKPHHIWNPTDTAQLISPYVNETWTFER